LLQRMAEYVAQDDAAPLRHGQPHEGPKTSRSDLAILDWVSPICNHVQILSRMPGLFARASTEEIQSRVVGDTKQPTLGIGYHSCSRCRLHRSQHGFLNDVLAIDNRPGHPRAVSV